MAVVGDSGDRGWTLTTCGEDEDRTTFDLPGVQAQLLAAIREAVGPQKPLIVVLVHGRQVSKAEQVCVEPFSFSPTRHAGHVRGTT